MGHIHIQWEGNQTDHQTIKKHTHQNSLQNTEQDTKLTKQHTKTEKYANSDIYQLKCLNCPLTYIGQTGRAFHTRYKEHKLAIKNKLNSTQDTQTTY
jgi:hypothetical protein